MIHEEITGDKPPRTAATRSGSVTRVAYHCQLPRFNSLNPPSIHDLIPYHNPSAWSGSRSGYQETTVDDADRRV